MPMHQKPSATQRFYEPGRKLLRWLDTAQIGRDHPFVPFMAIGLIGASAIWLSVDQSLLSIAFAIFAVLTQILVAYLAGAEVVARRNASDEIWNIIKRLNTDIMGHLAALLSDLRQRQTDRHSLPPRQFRAQMVHFQQHLLHHATNVIAEHIELEKREVLSANWTMRVPGREPPAFRVVVYDRHMADRQVSTQRFHDIREGSPGASLAYLSGEVAFVEDTRAEGHLVPFRDDARYRSILSFPVSLRDGEVLGVLNIDSTETGILDPDLEYLVRDIAYLVGLCECLKES